LTSDRPYRKALSEEEAVQYLREQANKQFDPRVVDVFLKMMSQRQ
jgi:HD-GYP domain-containing protein (c-di-GMP phosphodiesterase class II)